MGFEDAGDFADVAGAYLEGAQVGKDGAGEHAVEGAIVERQHDLCGQHGSGGVVELVVNVLENEAASVDSADQFSVAELDALPDGVEPDVAAQVLVQQPDHLSAVSATEVQHVGSRKRDASLKKLGTL